MRKPVRLPSIALPFTVLPLLTLLLLTLLVAGCGSVPAHVAGNSDSPATAPVKDSASADTPVSERKLTVITTLFPQYDFVRIIAGDRVEVRLILPPGIEPHTFEPTPKDIVEIGKADLFIYTGEVMEPWAGRILEGIKESDLLIVDASAGITLVQGDVHFHEEDTDENDENADDHDEDAPDPAVDAEADAHAEGSDPHIWLDPTLAVQMVRNITDALILADPDSETLYRKNADAYILELEAYDAECQTVFSNIDNRTILYGGHFAFGYFARRYDLVHISPYTGFSPDAEPTPRRIAELIDRINEIGATTIYFEELVDPKVAEVIASATGAEMVLLHGAHNVTRQQMESGISYLDIMRENLQKLKKGLGYHE